MTQSRKMTEKPIPTGAKLEAASTPVATFEIRCTRFLDDQGQALAPLPEFASDARQLIPLYRTMTLIRGFDTKAIAMQRTGQLGTYASILGEEAISVAVGSAMRADDVLLPAYRHIGAQYLRGVRLSEILLYWGGDERGMNYSECRHDFPMCIPVGSQLPHAVGVAYAMKLRRQSRVAVCMVGDGGTSKGDFYEAINAAGVWRLPAVFVVNNNEWAISIPRKQQTAAETIAQKAIAVGIVGEQCDGNDVVAVRHCVDQALARARSGAGPTLIEALTYRLSDHTTADDARRYRGEAEVKQRWQQEPLVRLRNYLARAGVWSDTDQQALATECASQVDQAVRDYQAITPMAPEAMFEFLYETLPAALVAQRQQVLERKK
jgi:2-oxoisovalerate dehydrogenase E1 component subunit alpha